MADKREVGDINSKVSSMSLNSMFSEIVFKNTIIQEYHISLRRDLFNLNECVRKLLNISRPM